jgi:transcriptional regulator with XRE-family HTH domain
MDLDHPSSGDEHEHLSPEVRDVKFSETLRELLDAKGYGRKHHIVADAISVSRSALSQYLSGKAQPSFATLIKLANVLETSLDYLVFGAETVGREVINPTPVARYVDIALADLRQRAADHAALVGRISQVLGSQIDDAARSAVDGLHGTPAGGLLSDPETQILEAFSVTSQIVSLSLKDDVVDVGGVTTGGRFVEVVARNLRQGRSYRFLLPEGARPWQRVADSFRRALKGYGVSDDALARRCLFRETTSLLPVEFVLLELDLESFRREEPILFERLRHAVRADGAFGYVIPPSNDVERFPVMDRRHLEYASGCFDSIWTSRATQAI